MSPAQPPDVIVIDKGEETTVEVVQGETVVVDVIRSEGPPGPQGPAGPAGPQGPAELNFTYTQLAPSATWYIVHNLNRFPAVAVVDSGGSELLVSVSYIDANELAIYFGSPTSGKAYLN